MAAIVSAVRDVADAEPIGIPTGYLAGNGGRCIAAHRVRHADHVPSFDEELLPVAWPQPGRDQ